MGKKGYKTHSFFILALNQKIIGGKPNTGGKRTLSHNFLLISIYL
jgi:hypothetical protein